MADHQAGIAIGYAHAMPPVPLQPKKAATIKLRWDMGWRSNRALTYYSPLKSKLLTRRTRLACDECNGTGTVLEFQDFPGATTDDYTSTPCPVCTKLIATKKEDS